MSLKINFPEDQTQAEWQIQVTSSKERFIHMKTHN